MLMEAEKSQPLQWLLLAQGRRYIVPVQVQRPENQERLKVQISV
jgi:hypothetical protein